MDANFWASAIVNGLLFYFAYKLGQWVLIGKIASLVKEKDLEEIDDPNEDVILNLEKHPEGYFAYADHTGDFIANHVTTEGLFQRIKERYPKSSFRLAKPTWASEKEYLELFETIVRVFGSSR